MPRCQRTFQRFPAAAQGDERWVCPFCLEAEVYEAVRDTDLLQYARLAETAATQEFGRPGDASRGVCLFQGLRPECVFEPGDRRYDIYLQQGSDALQLRLQIGHEIFHRVCSQGGIFHWTHEMLACLFSVRLLRQQGFEEYAAQTAREYENEAAHCSPETFFGADLWKLSPYPPGFYGRAYVTGAALKSVVGWPALCRLARFRVQQNGPDVNGWLAVLPGDKKSKAACILNVQERVH